MDFRTRNTSLKEKMKAVYGELNNFSVKKNKIKLTKNKITPSLSKKNEDRIKLFDKIINSPMKQNKYHKNIIYLIEETKRNNLGYKTFLDFNKDENSDNLLPYNYYKPNRKYSSANSSFNLENKLDNLSRNSSKKYNLKKEIMTELESDKKKYSTGSTYFSSNKSFKDFNMSKY